ncbi:uncharacterized protein AMSG_08096 [Thecamonas trahens ATCC 50062]|uniref:Mechanosensitive ion channel MscS domain-containing protein n=1 Tax=Thecamonas trahens ATCC 50062 TaxID=461836 RepID=A0A0L0DKF4_THETB|nr:hypothetical protein AMSG_08096 [Thecamonas trahens ATCC 50062]KNC52531.1 hypothetical protein AMSG_08096 [Thecamonas trahens ATCC 50062]|eukprot:XP_013755324.1 hypothetical protein AMSG_08096 [Thecamonas trahens ATCC 50062]
MSRTPHSHHDNELQILPSAETEDIEDYSSIYGSWDGEAEAGVESELAARAAGPAGASSPDLQVRVNAHDAAAAAAAVGGAANTIAEAMLRNRRKANASYRYATDLNASISGTTAVQAIRTRARGMSSESMTSADVAQPASSQGAQPISPTSANAPLPTPAPPIPPPPPPPLPPPDAWAELLPRDRRMIRKHDRVKRTPMLGIPLIMPMETQMFTPGFIRAFLSVPLAALATFASIAFALAGLVVALTPAHEQAYALPLEHGMWFWSAALAGWVVMRLLITVTYNVLKPRFYLTFTFYLFEGAQLDLTSVCWAITLLIVTPTVVDSGTEARLRTLLVDIQLMVLFVFLAHLIKFAIERVYLEHIHFELFGAELEQHVKNEEIVCKLTTCCKRAKEKWMTPVMPPHTHDLHKTMRALLGQVLSDDLHLFSEGEKRQASAVRAADLMENLDRNDKGYFNLADLERVMDHPDAVRAMSMFAASRRINLATLEVDYDLAVSTIFDIFQSRETTYRMLRDRGQVASVLHAFTGALFWSLVFFFILSFLGVDVLQVLLPLLLGLAFIFGSSAQAAWQSFLYIFVVRPFFTGDRFTLEGYPTLIVDSIYLFTTEAHSPDGRQFIIPNSMLFTSVLTSYKRSKDYAINATINMDSHVTAQQVADIEARVLRFFFDDNSAPWNTDNFMVWVDSIENSANKLTLNVWIGLLGVSWQRPARFLVPKSRLLLKLQEILIDLGITFVHPTQPIVLESSSIPRIKSD